MTYQVLARKWRPQDVRRGRRPGRRSRARCGTRWPRAASRTPTSSPARAAIGKTTTARLLARALLCPERTGAEPCGTCPVVRGRAAGAAGGRHRDRRRLQPRHRGDPHAARERQVRAGARPLQGLHHRRGPPAHRAPPSTRCSRRWRSRPPHVVFVLATTDPRDIPATMLSRVPALRLPPDRARAADRDAGGASSARRTIAFEPAALPAHRAGGRGLAARRALAARHGHRLRQRPARRPRRRRRCSARRRRPRCAPSRARCSPTTRRRRAGGDRPRGREGEDLGAFTRDVIELLRRALVLKAAPAAKLADVPTPRPTSCAR